MNPLPAAVPESTPQWRPSFHFTPAAHWMNDPNGLVHHRGVWHLFFQYHPHGLTWGPMHWGHATSTDLLHWTEQPVALAPDAQGMIFSGSAVFDAGNRSGLGRAGQPPLVAVYTLHDDEAGRAGSLRHQHQALAVSLDDGRTWTRHAGNPVLPNPGLKDFRDPKVFWHEGRQRWVMSLAAGDHIAFHSSPDLQQWTHDSDFRSTEGTLAGVWECPDLVELRAGDVTRWVLLVSVAKGGPAGGSGTQVFVGHFDGWRFQAEPGSVHWLDHGPDNYAGVTWAHAPQGRTVLLGWMSNWDYAALLPTAPWRGAMTVPRELALRSTPGGWRVAGTPVPELLAAAPPLPLPAQHTDRDEPGTTLDLSAALQRARGRLALHLRLDRPGPLSLRIGNASGDEVLVAGDASHYTVDRRNAGVGDFHAGFAAVHRAPRPAPGAPCELWLLLDGCSVELFGDQGLCALTSLVFPRQPYDRLTLQFGGSARASGLSLHAMPA